MCKSEKQKFMNFIGIQTKCSEISWVKFNDTTAKVPMCKLSSTGRCRYNDCPKIKHD